jgi:hypothetical protein
MVAVLIAILAGGTSPWWWKELRPERRETDGTQKQQDATGPRASQPGSTPGNAADDTPANLPTADFPGGSRPAWNAAFSQWPAVTNEHGSVGHAQGSYVLRPTSNTWIGPGQHMPVTPLDADFVFDASFRITERQSEETALQLMLVGAGEQADYVNLYLMIGAPGTARYTLERGWIKDRFYVTRDQTFADGELLEPALAGHDWSQSGKLTLKRERGEMQLFVNDVFVRRFPVPLFTVTSVGVGAAWPAVVTLGALAARVPA